MKAQSLIINFYAYNNSTFFYCVYCTWSYVKIAQNKKKTPSHNRTVTFTSVYKFVIVVDACVLSY